MNVEFVMEMIVLVINQLQHRILDTDEEVSDILLSGVDPNDDDLTFSLVSSPENGILAGDVPNLIYTPDENFNGTDTFSFTVTDGQWVSIPGTVSITVNLLMILCFSSNW